MTRQHEWSCWPAGCRTSATSRCAPGAGSPRRCAASAREATVRDVDADLMPWLRARAARLRLPAPARRGRRGRRAARGARAAGVPVRRRRPRPPRGSPSTSRSPSRWSAAPGCARRTRSPCRPTRSARSARPRVMDAADRAARAAAGRQAGQGRLCAGLLGRAHRRRAARRDGRLLRLRPGRAGRALHRGRRGGGAGRRRPAADRARCRRWRSGRTAASTTTPRATPRARRSSSCRPSSTGRLADGVRRGRRHRAPRRSGCATCPARDLIIDADGRRLVPRGQRRARDDRDVAGAAVGRGRRARPRSVFAALVDVAAAR